VITSPRFKSRPARHSGRRGRPGPVHRGRPPVLRRQAGRRTGRSMPTVRDEAPFRRQEWRAGQGHPESGRFRVSAETLVESRTRRGCNEIVRSIWRLASQYHL